MISQNKTYWLYIEPYIYCCIKGTNMLLYNTKNNARIENASKEIISLIQSLYEKENLGAISIEGNSLIEKNCCDFIKDFCEKGMGNIIDSSQTPKKPIQLMPVLNLQRDIDKLLNNSNYNNTGEEFLTYLLELNLYLNDTCDLNCQHCSIYFKQNLCCTKCFDKNILDIVLLKNILSQVENAPIGKLNILGGNILKLSYLNELQELLLNFKERVNLWIHYENIVQNKENIPDFKKIILVTFPVNEMLLHECVQKTRNQQCEYRFLISSKQDYETMETLLEKYNIKAYNVVPVYTQKNFDFFEENIFVSKEDIFSEALPFRKIFAHQKLNTNFFGSLTILPAGNVYANVNCSEIGNIKTDSILSLIDKEMKINTAWRTIREKAPCNDCLYQFLCPSPSNYEAVIGKHNLCYINE